jgi:hypothetical protein
MHETIEFRGPTNGPTDRKRTAEGRKEAKVITRQIIVQMVRAGWRESEAALALADAFDDYCLYLAEHPREGLHAANSNLMRAAS